jgi:cytochrome c oxidase assembly protein subunit 15
VRGLGGIALLAIIVQGVLGGLTVLFQLPTPISVAHAALAQSFFSLTVVLALVTSPGWWQTAPAKSVTIETTRLYALWTTGVIFLQLVLGAWMRHSNAGLAIPDFPLSYGKLVPPFGLTGLAGINQMRSALSLTSVHLGQVWINFAHRAGALAVLVMSIVTTIHVLRRYRSEQRLREPAIIFQLLVIFQVAFGALTVWTGKGVEVTTIHVATGALVLAASVLLSVRTFQIYKSSDAFIPAPDHRRAGEPRTLVEGRLGTMAGG